MVGLRWSLDRHLQSTRLAEVHAFKRLDWPLLFNVEDLAIYAVTPLILDLVEYLKSPSSAGLRNLRREHSAASIREALRELSRRGIVRSPGSSRPPKPDLSRPRAIRHLELLVTHGCNMRCRYCYGASGNESWKDAKHLYGSANTGMPLEVARLGVDFLFRRSGRSGPVSIVFFGGEPLLELDLIREVVAYARRLEAEQGKRVSFSLSTNGSLLTEEAVDFLVSNRVGCQISIDGPPEIQDQNRRFAGGQPSYDRILPGVQRLIQARPGRVPARVTVSRGAVEIPRIVNHLLGLGFGSVHVEPVIGPPPLGIEASDIQQIERQNEELARALIEQTLDDQIFDYANLVRFVRRTHVVRQRLAYYCGAARTYLALAQDGFFYPCHRFVGIPAFRMGDVWRGFDLGWQRKILKLSVDERPGCSECWARYLCGGGCWQHALVAHGGLERPDLHVSCRLIRHQLECAMAVNAALWDSQGD